jgi:uncharacterized protein YciI
MFVVFLRFAQNRHLAGEHVDGHNAWIRRGVDDGVFLMVGSISAGRGGAILAHGVARGDLENRLQADPFVAAQIVAPEIVEIEPSLVDHRLAFVKP